MLSVNWFIPVNHRKYNNMAASVWIRCLQLLPYLEERGVQCKVNDPNAEADISVFVRWQDDRAYEMAQRQKTKGRGIIFDLCVNYFDETGLFEGGYGSPKEQVEECRRMVETADVITCVSTYIAQRARSFHPWVVYLPESVDGRHFRFNKPESDFWRRKLRAIWAGISPKARELEPILPLLHRHSIPLIVITNQKPSLSMDYRFIRWSYKKLPHQLLEGEICVAPRRIDNTYDLGHSLFKIGVFMALGVPAIASPVPSYTEVLKDGKGGMLCHTIEEWDKALAIALRERDKLVIWSGQAREAMRRYHTNHIADQYVSLFKELCLHKGKGEK